MKYPKFENTPEGLAFYDYARNRFLEKARQEDGE